MLFRVSLGLRDFFFSFSFNFRQMFVLCHIWRFYALELFFSKKISFLLRRCTGYWLYFTCFVYDLVKVPIWRRWGINFSVIEYAKLSFFEFVFLLILGFFSVCFNDYCMLDNANWKIMLDMQKNWWISTM